MGKHLRIRYIVIAFIFLLIACGGVAAAFICGKDAALSAVSYGSGTQDDPYRIYSSAQLNSLQEISSSSRCKEYTEGKYFKLCSNVKVDNSYGDYGSLNGFSGIFDGGGHTVTTASKTLFNRVLTGGAVKNVNFKLKDKVKLKNVRDYYYGVVTESADSGTLIENCHVYGDIGFQTFSNQWVRAYIGGICAHSNGEINNCTFNGNIIYSGDGILSMFYINGVSGGRCKTDGCAFNGNIDFSAYGMLQRVAGISYYGENNSCTFNGNIMQRKGSRYSGSRTSLYGIGQKANDCVFNGDVSNEHYKLLVCKIADDGSTFVHNGKFL